MGDDTSGKVGLNPTADFIAGALSGVTGLVIGHPFEIIKARCLNPTLAGNYASGFHAFLSIVLEERVIGLWKGMTSHLLTEAFLKGLVFASYHFFLKIQQETVDVTPTLIQIFIAGTLTGILCSIITTPTELVKVRQQEQTVPTALWKVAFQVMREDGILGFYRGITATILRDIGYGAHFAAYEGSNRLISLLDFGTKNLPWYGPVLSGGAAGIAGRLITYPFDVIKTKMQGTVQGYIALLPQEVDQATMNEATSLLTPNDDATMKPILLPVTGLTSPPPPKYNAITSIKADLLPQELDPGTVTGSTSPVLLINDTITSIETNLLPHELEPGVVAGPTSPGLPINDAITSIETNLLPHELGLPSVPGSLPINDTIKSIGANPYRGVVSTITHLYKEEGIGVFFQGLGITIIGAIPANMMTFGTFEAASYVIKYIHGLGLPIPIPPFKQPTNS
ncbi:hypothetical protein APHAL10511_000598 [Amanita phalloides]|nr:hypothetical protein APHAL10511_000598 [Amanita phalloides]